MEHQLTIIIPFYNAAEYIDSCISSVINQTNQKFELLIINDKTTDGSDNTLKQLLSRYGRDFTWLDLDKNSGHAHARNIALSYVETPYVMFLDADDTLAPYAIDVYLQYLGKYDALIAPISPFTVNVPNQFESSSLNVVKESIANNPTALIDQKSVSNIVFKTNIIKQYNIKFSTSQHIYSDFAFLISYSQLIQNYISLSGVSFYYCGEVYNPFNSTQLREQEFNRKFKDYISSFCHALDVTKKPVIRRYLLNMMLDTIYHSFDPSHPDIKERYYHHHKSISQILPLLKPVILKKKELIISTRNVDVKISFCTSSMDDQQTTIS